MLGNTVCLPAKISTQDIDCFVLYEVIALLLLLFLVQQGTCSGMYVESHVAGPTCSTAMGSFLKNYWAMLGESQ